jgi:thiamine-monophosphate kinase
MKPYNPPMRESSLLQHIYGCNASLPAAVTIPPGDDMAMLRLGGADVLVTVDQVADGVHFDLRTTPLAKVARKAITRNLSDVAAMAAVPVGAVVAGCLPRDFGEARANELFDIMRAVAESFGCPLVGGDIAMWDQPLVLTVTVLAEPAGVAPLTRRGAKLGDVVCVTGELGGSLEPLNGRTHHLDFEPRLAIARQLASDADARPHCMIDLSDGLASDLRHLCNAADAPLAAEVWVDRLPTSAAAHAAAHRDGRPVWRHALTDGEDYELCFTVEPATAERALPKAIEGVPVTPIGIMVPREDNAAVITVKLPDGTIEPLEAEGWEHKG